MINPLLELFSLEEVTLDVFFLNNSLISRLIVLLSSPYCTFPLTLACVGLVTVNNIQY